MQDEKSYLIMLPEDVLRASTYPPELHLDAPDEARESIAELHRAVDISGLSRHQVHVGTKQIIALRTQIADLQETVSRYEKECAYLHDQALINMVHHNAFAVARSEYETRIAQAEERIARLMAFDSCRRCAVSCPRVKNMCRACVKVTKAERKAKVVSKSDTGEDALHASAPTVIVPNVPIAQQPSLLAQKVQPPPKPMPPNATLSHSPRIIESEWKRDDEPMPEKSASGRRRAKRYTLMDF
jgi:hypothetical protein